MIILIKLNMLDSDLFGVPPELTGADLFMADIKALEVYCWYWYSLSKMWTKPLPETYDAEAVTEYFTLRPHVVILRLLEVIKSLAGIFFSKLKIVLFCALLILGNDFFKLSEVWKQDP